MKKKDKGTIEGLREVTNLFNEKTGVIALPAEMIDSSHEYYGVKADGHGMSSYGINNGDVLMFEVSDQISSGEIGTFTIGPEHKTLCRLYKQYENGEIWLLGDPAIREPIKIDPGDPNFHVIGKLTSIIKDVRGKKY